MRKKIAKPISNISDAANNVTKIKKFDEEYNDLFTGQGKPINETYIERISIEMTHWALNDKDALKVTQFRLLKGIDRQSWDRWVAKYPILKRAQEEAADAIGNRREIGGLTKKLDSGLVQYSMPHYDQDWKANVEWRSNLKAEQQNAGTQVVVIEKFPDSKLVPEKKK